MKRLPVVASLLVAAVLAAFPGLASAADQVEAGLWEVSVSVESAGMAVPPVVQTECLTREQANADPVPSLDKGACKATDVRRSGGKVTWKVSCTGTFVGRGEGEITYRGSTAYDGWMTLETGGLTVRSKLQARRVGGC